MEKTRNIFEGTGIPGEAISFFREYQRFIGTKWHMEKDGRFAQNFRYYMLQGLENITNIASLDLVVAGALLLSEHENYIRYVSAEKPTAPWANHELSKIQKGVRELATYMGKYGAKLNLCWPLDLVQSEARQRLGLKIDELSGPGEKKTAGQYLAFYCALPEIWKND